MCTWRRAATTLAGHSGHTGSPAALPDRAACGVRTGDTVTAYLSVKASGGAGDLPIEVARKENDKLKAALAAR